MLPRLDHHNETAENFLGPSVLVVRRLQGGRVEREWLPAAVAVEDVLHNPENGRTIASAHIEFFDVLDTWAFSP